jgi:hypothetical protein
LSLEREGSSLSKEDKSEELRDEHSYILRTINPCFLKKKTKPAF